MAGRGQFAETGAMLRIIPLEPDIAVAPQLTEADFAEIAARGFRSVVDSRPDGEASGQLASAAAAAAARRQGLAFRYQPVRSINVTDDDAVGAFAQSMDDLPGPILFYCGTGMRCATLWTQAAAPRLGADAALAVARKVGFELDFLRETLTGRREAVTPASPPSASAAQPFSAS
jgi:uncharacterized protein (TIGR01244 family)